MKENCEKCNSNNLFVKVEGTRKGLYCSKCGKWQKWLNKDEYRLCEYKAIPILKGGEIINGRRNSRIKRKI